MKITNSILTILFLIFAYLQWNDPDPYAWIAFYLFVAVVSGYAIFETYHKVVLKAGIGLSLIWAATLVPGVIDWFQEGMPDITGAMKAETPSIEITREFLGHFTVLATLAFHYFHAKKKDLQIIEEIEEIEHEMETADAAVF